MCEVTSDLCVVLPPGFMQFVQSVPVAEVLATEGNIQVELTVSMAKRLNIICYVRCLSSIFALCMSVQTCLVMSSLA